MSWVKMVDGILLLLLVSNRVILAVAESCGMAVYRETTSKVIIKMLSCCSVSRSYCCSSTILIKSKLSLGMCLLLKMRGLSVSSRRIAEFSVAQLMPDTIRLSGLSGLCVLGLK